MTNKAHYPRCRSPSAASLQLGVAVVVRGKRISARDLPATACSLGRAAPSHHREITICKKPSAFFIIIIFSPGIFVARLIFLQQQKLKSYLPAPDGRLGRNVCESAQSFGPWDSSRQTIFPLGGSQMLRGSLHCWKERLHSRFTRAS